jgi:hypothetical protein
MHEYMNLRIVLHGIHCTFLESQVVGVDFEVFVSVEKIDFMICKRLEIV